MQSCVLPGCPGLCALVARPDLLPGLPLHDPRMLRWPQPLSRPLWRAAGCCAQPLRQQLQVDIHTRMGDDDPAMSESRSLPKMTVCPSKLKASWQFGGVTCHNTATIYKHWQYAAYGVPRAWACRACRAASAL